MSRTHCVTVELRPFPPLQIHRTLPSMSSLSSRVARATLATLTVLGFGAPSGSFAQAARRFEIIGHRGAAALAPENTLASFRRACAIGVDGVELDVHLTADSVLVVHHDYWLHPDLARDSTGNYVAPKPRPLLRSLTLAQIKTYDVGRLRAGSDYAKRHAEQVPSDGERIPTLDEAIVEFLASCPRTTRLLVEIKTDPPNPTWSADPVFVANRVVQQLQKHRAIERAQVIAFDWRALRRVQQIEPTLPVSYLTISSKDWDTIESGKPGASVWMAGIDVDDFGGSTPRAVAGTGSRMWSPNSGNVTPESVEEAHKLGLKIYPWTANTREDMVKFIQMGVDGITTDKPDLLLQILKELKIR